MVTPYTGESYKVQGGGVYKVQGGGVYKVQVCSLSRFRSDIFFSIITWILGAFSAVITFSLAQAPKISHFCSIMAPLDRSQASAPGNPTIVPFLSFQSSKA